MRKLILGFVMLLVASADAFTQLTQEPNEIATRYGKLAVNDERMLLFNGRPLRPMVQGNNSLDLGKPFQVGTSDVVLVTDNGGTACPYMYYFVTVTRSGARATRPFGTCGELIDIKQKGDSISLVLSGFQGPFEPVAAQEKAARQRHVFVYRAGAVTENGKAVK